MTNTFATLETKETVTTPFVPPSWTDLVTHLNKWFHKPDVEALEVVLSAVAAHPAVQGDPCWLFVIGPSGSGKTEIIVNAIRGLANAHVLGAVNENSFVSFYRGEVGGILPRLKATNNSGIFIFKDFTTMLSLRDEEKNKIMAQLREIYDGYWARGTGTGEHFWEGKVTCVAACTPALEDAWSIKRELGERFLTVRWPRIGGTALARAAGKQRGHETVIRKTTTALALKVLQSTPLTRLPEMNDEMGFRIDSLSEIVAILRGAVKRNFNGKREIVSAPEPEEPGRIRKSLGILVCAHAALWRREPTNDDFRLALRVAFDSIPPRRLDLFRHFPLSEPLKFNKLIEITQLPESTIDWNLEELLALKVVKRKTETDDVLGVTNSVTYTLTPNLQTLLRDAQVKLPF
jgi:hypothetical protein